MDEQKRIHKFYMQKLLIALVDNPKISQGIYFKGGTAASMLGFLDRFSVDLDFDIKKGFDREILRNEAKKIIKNLDFEISKESKKSLFFVIKYKTKNENQRNTLKFSFFEEVIKANIYKPQFMPEIDRFVNCQTVETMFANKLVAPIDRFNRKEGIAGRDIYDIHYFFLQGYKFGEEIIEERTKMETKSYIKKLIDFIEEKVTDKILTEDLNTLLPYEKFKKIRNILKPETLLFLRALISI